MVGYFFFTSFLLIVTLIFLNLFIAIILQVFADVSQKEDMFLNDQAVDDYRDKWSELDPNVCLLLITNQGTGLIEIDQIGDFLRKIGPPLGWDESYETNSRKQEDFIFFLKLPTYNNFKHYHFHDVLNALSRLELIRLRMGSKEVEQNLKDDSKDEVVLIEKE